VNFEVFINFSSSFQSHTKSVVHVHLVTYPVKNQYSVVYIFRDISPAVTATAYRYEFNNILPHAPTPDFGDATELKH